MPDSTSVKSTTASPVASCRRTMSSPLMFQAVMSLVNGSDVAQLGSSSSFRPCGVESDFSVTTQVLLRSVVESSHCPIISFFSSTACCARALEAMTAHAVSSANASERRNFMSWPLLAGLFNRPWLAGLGRRLRDRGQHQPTSEPVIQIVDHELIHRVACYHGSRTNMWQQADILHGLQLVGYVRLPLEHVEGGS